MVFEPFAADVKRLERELRAGLGNLKSRIYGRVVENVRISAGVFGLEKMRNAFVRKHVSSAPVDRMHQIVSRK